MSRWIDRPTRRASLRHSPESPPGGCQASSAKRLEPPAFVRASGNRQKEAWAGLTIRAQPAESARRTSALDPGAQRLKTSTPNHSSLTPDAAPFHLARLAEDLSTERLARGA